MTTLLNRLGVGVFLVGLCLLAVIGGAGTMYYKLPGAAALSQGFEGGKAWYHRWKEIREEPRTAERPSDADLLAQSKTYSNKEQAYDGYTLISLRSSTNVYLLDMQGHVVHRWQLPFDKSWPNPTDIHLLAKAHIFVEKAALMPDGDLIASYTGTGDTPYGYGMVKADKDSNILWRYGDNTHHSFYINRQSGYIYALTHHFVDEPERGLENLDFPILGDFITRLSPDGHELDRISVLDAFRDLPFASMLYFRTRDEAGDEKWDLLHSNAVMELEPDMAARFPMFKPGQLLISLRRMSALAVIDPVTRRVVWAKQGAWKGQHAAQFLPNGHILLFDNLGYATRDRHFSRVLEIDPLTGNTLWSFTGSPEQPFYSEIFGFLQRLPNGNTLISESEKARVLETTPAGKIAWSYALPNVPGENGNETEILSAPRYTRDELPFLTAGTL